LALQFNGVAFSYLPRPPLCAVLDVC